jgi:hypothetical protein
LNTTGPHPQAHAAQQRRGHRVLLAVSFIVSGERPNNSPFSERTKTQVVNAHGAQILLHEPMQAGRTVRVTNIMAKEEISCTVVDIGVGSGDVPEVGLSFAKATPSFWRVSFPPEDWTPRSPDAKRISSIAVSPKPVVAKK